VIAMVDGIETVVEIFGGAAYAYYESERYSGAVS